MDKRKELILNTIIKEHVKSGVPISSANLAEKCKLDISPATIRNEMVDLEEMGYIIQPHTSAGRIPTEKAYRLFIEKLNKTRLSQNEESNLDNFLREKNELNFKETAKEISQFSGNTVFWAFHRHNLYYTGISNLLSQPEFARMNLIYDISAVIDQMDEIVDKIFENFNEGVHTLIGADNPFGELFSTVLVKYKAGTNIGLFGILGPMRMDYKKNIAIGEYILNKMINKL